MKKTHLSMLFLFLLLAACGPRKSDETSADAASTEADPGDEEHAVDQPTAGADTVSAAATEQSNPSPAADVAPKAAAAAAVKNTYKDGKGRTVYTIAETPPVFTGGESEMNKWLRKNLKYPATDAEGTVFVSFVVDNDGSVSESKVESGAEDQKLRDEALRVVSGMPKWTPGKQGGKVVPVKFTLPVTFKRTPA
jgi:protein TonB